MMVPYWRVGMTIHCEHCPNKFQVKLNAPVSFQYETTYSEFIDVVGRISRYDGVQELLSDAFQVVKIEFSNAIAVRSDGSRLTLADLHESIQKEPALQNSLYSLRMNIER